MLRIYASRSHDALIVDAQVPLLVLQVLLTCTSQYFHLLVSFIPFVLAKRFLCPGDCINPANQRCIGARSDWRSIGLGSELLMSLVEVFRGLNRMGNRLGVTLGNSVSLVRTSSPIRKKRVGKAHEEVTV